MTNGVVVASLCRCERSEATSTTTRSPRAYGARDDKRIATRLRRSRRQMGLSASPRDDKRDNAVMKRYYVYILANVRHTVLYAGVTNNLARRLEEHKRGLSAFTRRYNVHKLVYVEEFSDVREAIAREKQIKGGSRQKKLALIDGFNPSWRDLAEEL